MGVLCSETLAENDKIMETAVITTIKSNLYRSQQFERIQ
jgi:hypothetical protein